MYRGNVKWIRIFWLLFVMNAATAMAQIFFTYGHLVKHEWFLAVVTTLLIVLNVYGAKNMFKSVQRIHREEREKVIKILSGNHTWQN